MRQDPTPALDPPDDTYATWAGPYVLGALSPADADAFARHLPECPACREAVQDLAALPGLLSRVPLEAVDGFATGGPGGGPAGGALPSGDAGPVPDTLLPALLRSVRAQRRRRRWAGGAAAGLVAASVVAAVVVTSGVVGSGRPDGPGQALPSPSSPASPTPTPTTPSPGPLSVLRPLLPTPLTITARLTGVDWGTQVDITCAYAPATTSPPYDYALVVTDRAGSVEQIGTWTAVPGHDAQVTGATALPRTEIASVEVRTLDGTAIARLDPTPS
ncbi:anti-sigma factor family protein [Kineococcus rubinsiae]|uniref:anti-sigma factor family protein n=1 Tax=Kineococcus rubinsiae TaxID=2609562 RepID=UPI001430F2AC|nr:zf-HC2 domain-containing protein [Kineococcus rubinsiae]NIZ93563.1 zf-HC2 domain-containing protein [Kineococcus rubinsiae]